MPGAAEEDVIYFDNVWLGENRVRLINRVGYARNSVHRISNGRTAVARGLTLCSSVAGKTSLCSGG